MRCPSCLSRADPDWSAGCRLLPALSVPCARPDRGFRVCRFLWLCALHHDCTTLTPSLTDSRLPATVLCVAQLRQAYGERRPVAWPRRGTCVSVALVPPLLGVAHRPLVFSRAVGSRECSVLRCQVSSESVSGGSAAANSSNAASSCFLGCPQHSCLRALAMSGCLPAVRHTQVSESANCMVYVVCLSATPYLSTEQPQLPVLFSRRTFSRWEASLSSRSALPAGRGGADTAV